MAKSKPRAFTPATWLNAALAATLLASFFLPWLSFLGAPVAAHEIRETLRGPHRLISAFTRNSQVSLDYSLSLCLWAIPLAAALVLVLCLLRRDRAWTGLVAGAVAITAFLFLRVELNAYPFQRLEEGAYLAFSAGIGFILVALLRLGFALRR